MILGLSDHPGAARAYFSSALRSCAEKIGLRHGADTNPPETDSQGFELGAEHWEMSSPEARKSITEEQRQELDEASARARKALAMIETYDQARVDRLCQL